MTWTDLTDPDTYMTLGVGFAMLGAMMCCIGCILKFPQVKLNHDIKTSEKKSVQMKSLTTAFLGSFKTFFGEAVIKPWQPLGVGMFVPFLSGNWKGALQQWLVIHLYQWTLILLAFASRLVCSGCQYREQIAFGFIFLLLFLVYETWHFWFGITQRKPIGLPAVPVSFLFTIPMQSFLFLHFYMSGFPVFNVVGVFGCVVIGFLMTAFFVFERAHCAIALHGLSVPLLSGLLLSWVDLFFRGSDAIDAAMLIMLALTIPTYAYLAICMMVIGCKGMSGKQDEDAQEEVAGKRGVSKQSVSTAPTCDENHHADIAHVRDEP